MARLLIVDDEPDVEAMISQVLRKRVRSGELDLLFAGDGFEALETLTKGDAFGRDAILTTVAAAGTSFGPEKLVAALQRAAKGHRGEVDQADDLALVGLRWTGEPDVS